MNIFLVYVYSLKYLGHTLLKKKDPSLSKFQV